MAVKTAVGGAGQKSWTSAATWSPSGVPTTNDDVILNATSGDVLIGAAASCRSLDCTGYTGTLTHAAASPLTIGAATAPPGNLALKLVPGMTYTAAASSASILFACTALTATLDVDWGGKTTGNTSFSGGTTTWRFVSDHTQMAGSTVTQTAASKLDTNGVTCVWGLYNANAAAARTLTLGTSTITLTSTGSSWNLGTAASISVNMVVNAVDATINVQGNFLGGGRVYGNVVLLGLNPTVYGTNTFGNLSWPVPTNKLTLDQNQVVTGTFTADGGSRIGQGLIQSDTPGSRRTLTAANLDVDYMDFVDIAGAGAATWDFSARDDIGDGGNNSGISFSPPQVIHRINRSSVQDLWSEPGDWSTTPNGANDARIPLLQDTAMMAQGTPSNISVVLDIPRLGTVDWRGALNTGNKIGNPQPAASGAVAIECFGSWYEHDDGFSANPTLGIAFGGRGNHEIRFRQNRASAAITFNSGIGTHTLTDTMVSTWSSNSAMSMLSGTLNTAGYEVHTSGGAGRFNMSGGVLNLGTTLWRSAYSGVGAGWSITGGVVNGADSTIDFYQSSANPRSFSGGGQTYGVVRSAVGSGAFTIGGGNNTFSAIEFGGTADRQLLVADGTTQTFVGAGLVNLSAPTMMAFASTTGHTLVKGNGVVATDYWNISNSTAGGGAAWYAGAHSVDAGGNSGWVFTAAPAGGGFVDAAAVSFSGESGQLGAGALLFGPDEGIIFVAESSYAGAGSALRSSGSGLSFAGESSMTGIGAAILAGLSAMTGESNLSGSGALLAALTGSQTGQSSLSGAGAVLAGAGSSPFSAQSEFEGYGVLVDLIYLHLIGPFTALGIDSNLTGLIAESIAAGVIAEIEVASAADYVGAGETFEIEANGVVDSNEASGVLISPEGAVISV